MSTYQPGIPTGTVNLDQDYLNIQGNFQQLNTTFAVDHTSFANQTPQNGYHKTIHQIPFSTTASNPPNNIPVVSPAPTPGYAQIFTAQANDGLGLDEILFFLTSSGDLLQLTRNFQPTAAQNGNTFVPGGVSLCWNIINGTNSPNNHFEGGDTGGVTFANVFANSCFGVFFAPVCTGATFTSVTGTATVVYNTSTLSKTGFDWKINTNSSQYTKIFWLAIGN